MDRKVTDYELAYAGDHGGMAVQAKTLIRAGLQPLGAPFVWGAHIVQAFVKYDPEELPVAKPADPPRSYSAPDLLAQEKLLEQRERGAAMMRPPMRGSIAGDDDAKQK